MTTAGEDRRRYPRSRRAAHGVSDDGPGVLNHIDNISATGVLCHTVKPVPLMTKLGIAFTLSKPSERRIEAEGIVVRCEPHELGDDRFMVAILFTRISDADREAIEEHVNRDLEKADLD